MKKIGLPVLAMIILGILLYGSYARIGKLVPGELARQEKRFAADLARYAGEVEATLEARDRLQIRNRSGSLSNFEGPVVEIAYLSHHGDIWDKEKEPYFTLTGSELKFDPDHADYGLPDLNVEVSQPRFVTALHSGIKEQYLAEIQKYLPNLGDIQPVKTYEKTYKAGEGRYRKEKFALYITEFDITLGIKPLRAEPAFALTREEKNQRIFPRRWYQHDLFTNSSRDVAISDFKDPREFKNKRYSKVHVVFRITPNSSAWYVSDGDGRQVSARAAVGSLVTKNIESNIKIESDYREAQVIPGSPGIHLKMYKDRNLAGLFQAAEIFREQPETIDPSVFSGEPVYFRIVSDNIGSWDDRLVFWGEEWDDQFTLKLFMPLLVKGELEVALDSRLLPQYAAPEPFQSRFSFSDVLPDWGLQSLGTYFSYVLILFALLLLILYLPGVFTLVNAIFERLARLVKPGRS